MEGIKMTKPEIVKAWCFERVGCPASPARADDGSPLSAEE